MSILGIEWVEGEGPKDITQTITSMIDQFMEGGSRVAIHMIYGLTKLARVVYILLIVLGVFLYFTQINRRTGKSLIIGGVIMAFTFEYIIPYLLSAL